MNCQELTTAITNIKAQTSEFDTAVGARNPNEAIKIKNEIEEIFNGELLEYTAPFYRDPTPENYDKEVNRILNKIGDRDPLEVSFSRKELILIYDTDDKAKFSNFSHESVTSIYMIREKRIFKQKEDASIIFNLSPDQIVWSDDIITPNTPKEDIDSILKERIDPNTKLYIGPLFTGIFNLPNLEHIYTSFPEGKIRRGEFTTCGKKGKILLKDMEARGVDIDEDGFAQDMLQSSKFVVHKKNETILTVRLKVSDLFPDGKKHTYEEIITRAIELGLDNNLPHETASNLLLNESTQSNLVECYSVASKTIANRIGGQCVFGLARDDRGLYFDHSWANPGREWYQYNELLFGLRPKTEQSSV